MAVMADWTIVHQCQCYLAAKDVGSHRTLKWKELAWDSGISRGEFEVTIPKMTTMNTKTIVENRTVYFKVQAACHVLMTVYMSLSTCLRSKQRLNVSYEFVEQENCIEFIIYVKSFRMNTRLT